MKVSRIAISTLFVALLAIPVTLGLPMSIGSFSFEAPVAEARTGRSTDTLRGIRSSHSSIDNRFFMFQGTHTLTVPVGRANVTLTAQRSCTRSMVRVRVGNGSWTSWRRANVQQRVSVPTNGTRVVRFQVRSENRRFDRTYRVNVRRASANTWADRLTANTGTFNHRFERSRTSYVLTLPDRTEGTRVELSLRAAHNRAEVRHRIQNTSRGGANPSWPRWRSTSTHWRHNRTESVTLWGVGTGEVRTVRFQILGAWNTLTSGSNRTRTYTVTVRKGPQSYQAIFDHYAARIRERGRQPGATQDQLQSTVRDGRFTMIRFASNQHGHDALNSTRDDWARRLEAVVTNEFGHLPRW